MHDTHPNDLQLDALRAGEPSTSADADPGAHVARCVACQSRLAELRVLGTVLAAPFAEIAVPPAQDAWLIAAAHNRGREITASRRRRALLISAPLLAAAALLAVFVAGNRHAAPVAPVAREDVNHDGRVDILDAFALERAVEARTAPLAWDFNHDGIVDAADVRRLADAAVSVGSAAGGAQ